MLDVLGFPVNERPAFEIEDFIILLTATPAPGVTPSARTKVASPLEKLSIDFGRLGKAEYKLATGQTPFKSTEEAEKLQAEMEALLEETHGNEFH